MPLWPFRRKSGRKRSLSGAAISAVEGPHPRGQTEGVVARDASKKKQRVEPAKLQRRTRAYSFSPGRQDELEHRRKSPDRRGPGTRRRDDNVPRQESAWERTPTLHHNQSRRLSKRKSSRRKKEESARAAEIKAMSSFEPIRPATDSWAAGRPMKKDSKRFKSAPFRGHPSSDISLPIPESIHSSMTSDSEHGAFKVSALDSLAPRPTLRYAPGSRWTPTRSAIVQSASQRRPLADKEPIAEKTWKEHKRVDDLADDLDARDLRELMEREDRRRERKRLREQERASRRLARQAEKQKAAAEEARKSGTPPPENLERGVAGRELVGLGIDPASAVVTTTEQRHSVVSERMPDADDIANQEPPKSTDEAPRQMAVAPSEEPAAAERETKPQDSATSLAQSFRFAGLLRSKKSRSKSTLASEKEKGKAPSSNVISEEDAPRHSSWGSDKRGRFSLTSFLRRAGKSKRNSGGPPSFSNTSREEMHSGTAQTPAQALARLQGEDVPPNREPAAGSYLSRKPSASAALRTKSRFREDLPDFPISPPDSRVQSPEAEPSQPAAEEQHVGENGTQPIAMPSPQRDATYRRTPTSMSPEPHSISLASIDSEGSWLSGQVGARRSAMRERIARANRLEQSRAAGSPSNSTQEDLSITGDDYMARLAPQRHSGLILGSRRSGDGRPSSDEEDLARDSGARWGAVGAQPCLVRAHSYDKSSVHSHEGLMNTESGDEDGTESPVTPTAQEKMDVQRARSVNLGRGGHVRTFSAGSAKLLDITPRSSVDCKVLRNSERRASGPLL